ncbi:MAG: hypothetical protein V3U52_08075 [Thermoplasmata archaeon]
MTAEQPKERGIDLPLISPRQLDSDEVELVFPQSHLHIREEDGEQDG